MSNAKRRVLCCKTIHEYPSLQAVHPPEPKPEDAMAQAAPVAHATDSGGFYAGKYSGFDGVFASSKDFKEGLVGLVGPPPSPADAVMLIQRRTRTRARTTRTHAPHARMHTHTSAHTHY